MPDGTNTNASRQVVSALNSIPFGNIIGGPLAACVQAQAEEMILSELIYA